MLASLRNGVALLSSTAAAELPKSYVLDFVGVGLGTAWLLLGVNTMAGLKQEDYMASKYATRYFSKYRKLAAAKKEAGHH